jgi:hypothetical protein
VGKDLWMRDYFSKATGVRKQKRLGNTDLSEDYGVVTQNTNHYQRKNISAAFTNLYIFFFYWRYNPLWVCILQPLAEL